MANCISASVIHVDHFRVRCNLAIIHYVAYCQFEDLVNRVESRKQLKISSTDRMATTISTQRGQVRCLCLEYPL